MNKTTWKENMVSFGFEELCPLGTVLIKRTTMEDLVRAKKQARQFISGVEPSPEAHQAVLSMKDIKVYGAVAEMGVYHLSNIWMSQYSLAQVKLMKGERGPRNFFNTIQFGWQISYQQTGDSNTHLFIFWTSDGYQKTGGLNLYCPGFVQISNAVTPGTVIPTGTKSIKPSTFKDPVTGNWLLAIDDQVIVIGYWPKEIFNNMADCSQVDMGGYAYSPIPERSPPMGSGKLPNPNVGAGAAEFKQVAVMKGNGDRFSPHLTKSVFEYDRTLSAYYQAAYYGDHVGTGYAFQYGGPGGWTGVFSRPSSIF